MGTFNYFFYAHVREPTNIGASQGLFIKDVKTTLSRSEPFRARRSRWGRRSDEGNEPGTRHDAEARSFCAPQPEGSPADTTQRRLLSRSDACVAPCKTLPHGAASSESIPDPGLRRVFLSQRRTLPSVSLPDQQRSTDSAYS